MPIPFHPYRHDDSTRSVREHIKTLKYIIKNIFKFCVANNLECFRRINNLTGKDKLSNKK